jgi:hypothetical protein
VTRATLVWLGLVVATLVAALIGEYSAPGGPGVATAAVIIIALVKARFVGLEFMELRGAPVVMRIAYEMWTVLVCTVLLGLYLL